MPFKNNLNDRNLAISLWLFLVFGWTAISRLTFIQHTTLCAQSIDHNWCTQTKWVSSPFAHIVAMWFVNACKTIKSVIEIMRREEKKKKITTTPTPTPTIFQLFNFVGMIYKRLSLIFWTWCTESKKQIEILAQTRRNQITRLQNKKETFRFNTKSHLTVNSNH